MKVGLGAFAIAAVATFGLAAAALASDVDEQTRTYNAKGKGQAISPEQMEASVKQPSNQIAQLLSVIAAAPGQGADFAVTLTGPSKGAKVAVAAVGAAKTVTLSDAKAAVIGNWTVSAATTEDEKALMIIKIAQTLGFPESDLSATAPGSGVRWEKK